MKLKQALPIAIAAAFALAASANAQSPSMRMDVPFPFLAGNEVLPAGVYQVKVDDQFHRLLIEPHEGGPIRALPFASGITERKQANAWDGVLQFQKIGERFVLRAAFRAGHVEGYYLMRSKAERELAKGAAEGETATVSELR